MTHREIRSRSFCGRETGPTQVLFDTHLVNFPQHRLFGFPFSHLVSFQPVSASCTEVDLHFGRASIPCHQHIERSLGCNGKYPESVLDINLAGFLGFCCPTRKARVGLTQIGLEFFGRLAGHGEMPRGMLPICPLGTSLAGPDK